MQVHVCLLFAVLAIGSAAERNASCATPNGENGTCISLNSCESIKQAIANFSEDAIEFAKKSQCGDGGTTPLVCCGSVGKVTPPPDLQPTVLRASFKNEAPWVPQPINNYLLPDSSICGLQLNKNDRIVGGKVTQINEFPWLVALKYTKNNGAPGGIRCSGTIINHQFILTAAQCLSIPGYNLTEVRLGEWRLSTEKDCDEDTYDEASCADPVVELAIENIIPHPYYTPKKGNNDIALLKVAGKINYTEFIRPICLPPVTFLPPQLGTRMHITGWGITENGTQSDLKLKVDIPIVANTKCSETYSMYVGPNQACAGGEEGRDACNGDSGGPLMMTYGKPDPTDDEQWFQEGIIYRGLGCGHKGVAGVYTRVSRYVHWILNNIEDD